MGCHTWFYKLLTPEEIEEGKLFAIKQANTLFNIKPHNHHGLLDIIAYNKIMDSINNNTNEWIISGWGFINLVIHINGKFYINLDDYHDIFRVKNYPRKIIYNLRGLRRYLRKDYFKLTQSQISELQQFWQQYLHGIISFG